MNTLHTLLVGIIMIGEFINMIKMFGKLFRFITQFITKFLVCTKFFYSNNMQFQQIYIVTKPS